MKVEYVDHMGSDKKIAQAARVSTLGLDNDREKVVGLIKALWREGHTSPFEHNVLTVAVEAPIFVAREWMRHRTASYSEFSMRYSEAKPKFYTPPQDRPLVQTGKALDYRREQGSIAQEGVVKEAHEVSYKLAWEQYDRMLKAGIANEVARNVLPVGVYTQFWATANLNNWFKFLTLRNDDHALWEIHELAKQVEAIIRIYFPIAWEAYRESR